MIVRPAQIEDLDDILTIENECFDCDAWNRRQFEEIFLYQTDIFIVAEDEERKICAYAIAGSIPRVELQVYSIATMKAFRRQGIAECLLEHLRAEAAKKEISYITLEVRKGNEAAKALYKKFGFKEDALRRNYYSDGEDAILMSLEF